jgi:hypothetical protein
LSRQKVTADARQDAERYVRDLYVGLLHREPESKELNHWTDVLVQGIADRDVFRRFLASDEYRLKNRVVPGHPVGHYYSPIVDPAELAARRPRRDVAPEEIPEIDLSLDRMRQWWNRNLSIIKQSPFPENEDPARRYYWRNNIYPFGDAVLLRGMIVAERPRRIIEIGSGFSSACILDAIDEVGLETEVTCIEPNPDRLLARLRPEDLDRIRLIESQVQDVRLEEFGALEQGDILFIDSSHVLKTGSDVNYELFSVLPVLAKGVFVHFHDIGYPFEYPDEWLFERLYSWNEAYAVRGFLMYNQAFRVEFMVSLFRQMARDLIDETFPEFARQPGGSLWIKKVQPPRTRAKSRWRRPG